MGKFAFVTFLTLVRAPLVVAGTLCVLANLARPSPTPFELLAPTFSP